MLLFDYLIGNSDRHQSNWAMVSSNGIMKWSPLYDNSSSLCAYIAEEQIKSYLGKDKVRWNSLVDTKSRSLIRCKETDSNRPTHFEVLNYIKNNYYEETYQFVKKSISVMTESNISAMVGKYLSNELSEDRKLLIKKYLLWKAKKMEEVYFGKEELDVD